MARSVIRNTLFFGRAKHSALVIPWTTYTSPEVAQVGLNLAEAKKQSIEIDSFTQPMSGVDRAILEGENLGVGQGKRLKRYSSTTLRRKSNTPAMSITNLGFATNSNSTANDRQRRPRAWSEEGLR